jgi:hypothetical protein
VRVGVREHFQLESGHCLLIPVGFLPRVLRSQGPPMRIVLY